MARFGDNTEKILVHLDLKGAPPKPAYLKMLYPMFLKWGVTGIILEWEDCFPYKDELKILHNDFYAEEDAMQIVADLKESKLEVIPLIQTFGHLEFVLKHSKFIPYREVPLFPSSLCPSHPNSLSLISAMVEQVVNFHGNIKHFHIGADEVWHMAMCEKCKARLEGGETREDLYLKHIKSVLQMIKTQWPQLSVIMWDDMLRGLDDTVILAYELPALVEPMVWHYGAAATFSLQPDLWRKYTYFSAFWTAGAFKGATGGSQLVPPVEHHADNMLQWLRCIKQIKTHCKGFVLTGWSRYDHFAALCESLPTSLVSLGVCLKVFKEEVFNQDIVSAIELELRPQELPALRKPTEEEMLMRSSWNLFLLTSKLLSLRQSTLELLSSEQLQTWMNSWQVSNDRVNPMQIIPIIPALNNVVAEFNELEKTFREQMAPLFFSETIDEWISSYIIILRSRSLTVLETAQEVVGKATKAVEEAKSVEMDY